MRYDLRCRNIPNALRQTAASYPDGTALVGEDGRRTFAELDDEMLLAVRAVQALGVRPGDRVAIWAPNCGRWILAALGALGAGAVLVPMNTRFKGEEAAYILRKSGARLLFVADDFLGNDYLEMLRRADPDSAVLRPRATVLLTGTAGDGRIGWGEFLAGGAALPVEQAVAAIDAIGPDSVSDIMFTSGTTGHPKGVVLTHGQSLRSHGYYSKLMGFRRADRYLIIPPFFHCFGYKAGWMACLVHGVTILPQATLDVDEVMRRIEQERVSILYGPPTVFQAILDSPRRPEFDLSSIRNVMASSTVVAPELASRIRDELRPEGIWSGYGLTEASALVTTSVPSDSLDHIVHTVGRPAWEVEVRLVDGDGADVAPGEPGELWVRGYNVTSGYWEDPERTSEAIDSDGWLHTGDVAVRDQDGYFRITDRIKDMILVGGFNVYPAEVERILGHHPDVESIAVVGAPDARLGEVPVAYVVVRDGATLTEQEFLSWSAERIANFKRPRRMIALDALPRNSSMKVLKNVLRDRAAALD
ncbi:AMP-binding protein [Nocardia flavorosea]|uniref:AMP-binding protein n=1 Tax=Nocardia flavorosea TaxID=53429 RepID=A0A846YNY7_9NOCA|nr:AMP-binding protein [Nocardia flavorosea]